MDKTLLKGLALLEALARSPQPRGVTDLAREQGIGRSNAHRTLQTLAAAGFVKQDETSAYSCTLKLFELGR
ncbi:MAG TPA: helix-turn-helix domain-containing protein, partial [Saliniramus sp.]|nr:helix-turn-helix domain-containing protein [Saliniramus sp.]